ncbi:Phosphoglycolate phosphatase [Dirofilaria immitis]
MNRSVNYSKLYGIVELEIEVTELLENISTALYYLQKLDLFFATNCELRIFQKDVTTLADAVTNLKYKIQKTEDIQCLTSSKEVVQEKNSIEMINKARRNIREPKELDDTQSESTIFHRRLAGGSSIIASERQYPLITQKTKKEIMPKGKKSKPGEAHLNDFKKIIEDPGYNHSKSNLSSYDFSNNSEISTFNFLWREKNTKKRKKPGDLKSQGTRNSENKRHS